jgi:hypothetical protein
MTEVESVKKMREDFDRLTEQYQIQKVSEIAAYAQKVDREAAMKVRNSKT